MKVNNKYLLGVCPDFRFLCIIQPVLMLELAYLLRCRKNRVQTFVWTDGVQAVFENDGSA